MGSIIESTENKSLVSRLALSIKHKMLIAFGIGALLTGIASAIAWSNFERVQHQVKFITETNLSSLTASMTLARQAADLTASAPAMLAANSDESLSQVTNLIENKTALFRIQIEKLSSQSINTRFLNSITNDSELLISNLIQLKSQLSERSQIHSELQIAYQQLLKIDERFQIILQPLITAIKTQGSMNSQQIANTNTEPVITILEQFKQQRQDEILMTIVPGILERNNQLVAEAATNNDKLLSILELKSDLNVIAHLLSSSLNLSEINAVNQARKRAEAAHARIVFRLSLIDHISIQKQLTKLSEQLSKLIFFKNSLFTLQTKVISLTSNVEQLLQNNRNLVASLQVNVEQLAGEDKALINQSVHLSEQAINRSRNTLLALSFTGVITAMFMAWLFSGPLIGKRLVSLAVKVRTITDGDLDVDIKVSGRDEISELEKGVIKFRETVKHRQEIEAELIQMANYDSLTTLPNRNLISDRIKQAIATAQSDDSTFAVIFIDLDRFKLVNDSQGHQVGDELLKIVGERLLKETRDSDTVGRLGGDEFAIIATGLENIHDISDIAHRVIDALSLPAELNQRKYFVGGSVGISLYPNDGTDEHTLLRKSDTAMYFAKDKGGGNFQFFSEEMNLKAEKRFTIENELRDAFQNDEFEMWFQPKVDFEIKQIQGVEALIRWHRPDLGYVSPAGFIPVAEEMGLIDELGGWVLLTSCQLCKEWHNLGFKDLTVAVNISTKQLLNMDRLEQDIQSALSITGLEASFLQLEVTESAMMHDIQESHRFLQLLREQGHKISLDDFGTGYSSLNYIRGLPIDELKIDKSFIDGIIENPKDAALTNTIITLGKNLKLKIVAEGVETREQFDYLKREGCDLMQGYFFSKPMPAHELKELLQQQARN